MTTYEQTSKRIRHQLHADDGGPSNFDIMIRHRCWDVVCPGDDAAGDENTYYLMKAPAALEEISVTIVSSDDVTEDDTDYIILQACSATGTTATLTGMMTAVNTKVTGGIDIDAGVAVSFTMTTKTLASGSWLALKLTKGGAGKITPPITVHVEADLV